MKVCVWFSESVSQGPMSVGSSFIWMARPLSEQDLVNMYSKSSKPIIIYEWMRLCSPHRIYSFLMPRQNFVYLTHAHVHKLVYAREEVIMSERWDAALRRQLAHIKFLFANLIMNQFSACVFFLLSGDPFWSSWLIGVSLTNFCSSHTLTSFIHIINYTWFASRWEFRNFWRFRADAWRGLRVSRLKDILLTIIIFVLY